MAEVPSITVPVQPVMLPAVTADASPVVTPGARLLRTVLQVLVTVLAAVPAAAALLPGDAARYAPAVGIVGAILVIVTALQNALENVTGSTLLARTPEPLPLYAIEPAAGSELEPERAAGCD